MGAVRQETGIAERAGTRSNCKSVSMPPDTPSKVPSSGSKSKGTAASPKDGANSTPSSFWHGAGGQIASALIKVISPIVIAFALLLGGYSVGAKSDPPQSADIADPQPSTEISIDGPARRDADSRCIELSGTGDTTTDWQIWSAASTAGQTGGEYRLIPVTTSSPGVWQVRLTIGDPAVKTGQEIQIDFFYLDKDSSKLLRNMRSQPVGSFVTAANLPVDPPVLSSMTVILPKAALVANC